MRPQLIRCGNQYSGKKKSHQFGISSVPSAVWEGPTAQRRQPGGTVRLPSPLLLPLSPSPPPLKKDRISAPLTLLALRSDSWFGPTSAVAGASAASRPSSILRKVWRRRCLALCRRAYII